ncbi:molybdopterin-dependent oxidoreductase [Pseudoruegeria sp. HB172150]|uniref:molybdopterin-dependent oxidoreductase n=1 Tax=Pseudoruegeria sp. HB172150 TaxID=2721164 RepID=UPI00352EF9D1
MTAPQRFLPHSSHWGSFSARLSGGTVELRHSPDDPDPSRIIDNFANVLSHPARLTRPMIRRGWLEDGPGPDDRRGRDVFVPVDWPEAIRLLSDELRRIGDRHGPKAIFAGSYGWSSAGRFHHAQGHVHRFMNTVMGGYVASRTTYSNGAAEVLLPHIIGALHHFTRSMDSWAGLAEQSGLVVCFGGLPVRNAAISGGGNSRHVARGAIARAAERGAGFVLASPIRDDLPVEADAEWLPVAPGTDTALMLGLAYHLVDRGLHDRDFLDRYTTGYPEFEQYLLGHSDGIPKTPAWAAEICGIPVDTITKLAERMAATRTMITLSYSLQRSRHGEQPIWMGITLAAMLGYIGLPGGGVTFGLGSIGNVGKPPLAVPLPTLPQGRNRVSDFIPVARIADMLLSPGDSYSFDGETRTYPDIRLVYWAGGNPFHHHQDLSRLARAFARPDTVVVNDSVATATAHHADIVLPATVTLERDDIGAGANDPNLVPMRALAAPPGEALDDYEIFARLARALGREDDYTEGRDACGWLSCLYERTRHALAKADLPAPEFDALMDGGEIALPLSDSPDFLMRFRADPQANPLTTPSGKIEITSQTLAGFNLSDCKGHPTWLPPVAEDKACPIVLVANQPARRLHSQLDFGPYSQEGKTGGRETVRMHPQDAASRGLQDGDTALLRSPHGACLAGVRLSEDIRPGVAQLSTGAWYSPAEIPGIGTVCVNGNPNALTPDIPSSSLTQGCAGQLVRVEISACPDAPPPTGHPQLPESA